MTTKQSRKSTGDPGAEMQPVRLSRAQVRGIYDRLAPIYDAWSKPFESRARARVLDIVGSLGAERILEVAVGPGAAFEKILRGNPHGLTVGLDISPNMLSRAAARAGRSARSSYLLLQADALHLPLPGGSFDLVTNSYMLDLLPVEDIRKVLAEFKRVLRPGGSLVLVNMTQSRAWLSRAWEWLYRRNPSLLGGCRAVLAAPFLEELGFADVQREVISQLSFPSELLTATHPRTPGPTRPSAARPAQAHNRGRRAGIAHVPPWRITNLAGSRFYSSRCGRLRTYGSFAIWYSISDLHGG